MSPWDWIGSGESLSIDHVRAARARLLIDAETMIDARMLAYDAIVGGGTRARRRYLAKLRVHLRGPLSNSKKPRKR